MRVRVTSNPAIQDVPQIKPGRQHSLYFLFSGSSASIFLGEESFGCHDTLSRLQRHPQSSSCQIRCA